MPKQLSLIHISLTLPGIAGIILAIGMGVDANVITAERIKEELNNGKSLDGALKSGFARGLTPVSYTHLDVYKRQVLPHGRHQ